MEKLYRCDVCGKESKSRSEIEECETQHFIAQKAKTMPENAVKCPNCKGRGGDNGSDGCDWHTCHDCDGVGFIIPKGVITIPVYQKIKTYNR